MKRPKGRGVESPSVFSTIAGMLWFRDQVQPARSLNAGTVSFEDMTSAVSECRFTVWLSSEHRVIWETRVPGQTVPVSLSSLGPCKSTVLRSTINYLPF